MTLEKNPRFRALGWVVAAGLIAFCGIQFVRPALTNPPVTAGCQSSGGVRAILHRGRCPCLPLE